MTRTDTLARISALVRRDHGAALWALAWLALDLPTEDLRKLLEGLEEYEREWGHPTHLQAYRERFGRVPDLPR